MPFSGLKVQPGPVYENDFMCSGGNQIMGEAVGSHPSAILKSVKENADVVHQEPGRPFLPQTGLGPVPMGGFQIETIRYPFPFQPFQNPLQFAGGISLKT